MTPPSTPPAGGTTGGPHAQAAAFLKREGAFRLGTLPTEQPHPATRGLSQTLQDSTPAGLRALLAVDRDVPPVLERVLAGDSFAELCDTLLKTLLAGRRVYFTGCGATGRLSILLEACWRRFWSGVDHPQAAAVADRVRSVMAGGDFALIRSVEGFEDFADFGRYQLREAGAQAGDAVVAITEGGETSFVIGTAWEALDLGARSFFVFNNPAGVLRDTVERSREVIEEPRITKLDLATGPMAVAGSTRMQATTIELIVVGLALEAALPPLRKRLGLETPAPAPQSAPGAAADTMTRLVASLETPDNLAAIAGLVEHEAGVYRRGGLVTYFADAYLLDVLTDTTERSPTFSLPPFRQADDADAVRSWSFVKHPLRSSAGAWSDLLGRPPQGLDWDASTYARMNASAELRRHPPDLSAERVLKFSIGGEPDRSRTDAPASLAVSLLVADEVRTHAAPGRAFADAVAAQTAGFDERALLAIGPHHPPAPQAASEDFRYVVCVNPPDSPLKLWHHVATKLVLNTVSTASMGLIGRLEGNWMVYVKTSNKKLIDRGVRLVADQAGVPYDAACHALFETLSDPRAVEAVGRAAASPVALTIARLRAAAI